LQSQLAGVDTLIADLSSDRNRLSEELAAAGNASIVATPNVPTHPNSNGMTQKLTLAAILGLVAGLMIAALAETVRPTVSGASRLGRLLAVPLLGRLEANPSVLQALGRRVRLAARKAGASRIVVTSASGKPVPEWAIDRLNSVVMQPLHGFDLVGVDTVSSANSAAFAGGRQNATGAGFTEFDEADDDAPLFAVSTLEDLTSEDESAAIGVLVLAGGSTNANAVHGIRDLLGASGWPLLGVVAHPRFGRKP
jgi:hypothetical protein